MPLRDLCTSVFKEGTYDFAPPKDVFLLGSFLTQTHIVTNNTATTTTVCDLGLEMPAHMFNERDYLNYRYFIKKSIYVAHMHAQLSALKKYATAVKFEFVSECNALYNPVLCMTFVNEGLEVRLRPVPPTSVFRPARFNPTQANVRREFFQKNLDTSGVLSDAEAGDETKDELTPMYNADLLADVTARENNEFLKKTFNDAKSVLEAIKLLKLWLIKRGLNKVN